MAVRSLRQEAAAARTARGVLGVAAEEEPRACCVEEELYTVVASLVWPL